MLYQLPARALACLTALGTYSAGAQTPVTPLPQGPSPESSAPVLYQSALEGYRPYSDEKVLSWKDSNDMVGKIGGWRVYAKEAQGAQPAGAKNPGAAGATPAAIDPHAGHGKR